MIKDVIVVIDSIGERAGPFALALTKQLDGFITAAAITSHEVFEPLYYPEGGYNLIEGAQEDAIALADAATRRLASRAQISGLKMDATTIAGGAEAEPKLLALCQTYDLIVVEQSEPGVSKPADRYVEAVLLRSGRPVLVVPYFESRTPTFGSITVAWDGSTPSARALADAIPLLQRATQVSVVTVLRDRPRVEDEAGPRLVQHLARHGVDAQFRALPSSIPVAETLLSHISDAGSDLLVMGAYGHSRLRETILGGASRGILGSMTVPVFMSH
jgi:nucleotide-binding universal stress UspA family protein